MRYRVISDPDKPCRREHVVNARSGADAVRRAILKEHDGVRSFKLNPDNIGEIERVNDRGAVNYVATIVPTEDNKPAPTLPQFAWLRVDGVWFWTSCIVAKLSSVTSRRETGERHGD